MRGPSKNLGLIGSAVLTFIGFKQPNRQTDKLNLYMDNDQEFKNFVFKNTENRT